MKNSANFQLFFLLASLWNPPLHVGCHCWQHNHLSFYSPPKSSSNLFVFNCSSESQAAYGAVFLNSRLLFLLPCWNWFPLFWMLECILPIPSEQPASPSCCAAPPCSALQPQVPHGDVLLAQPRPPALIPGWPSSPHPLPCNCSDTLLLISPPKSEDFALMCVSPLPNWTIKVFPLLI